MRANLLTLALCVCQCTGFVPSFAPKPALNHASNGMNSRPAVVGMHMALKKATAFKGFGSAPQKLEDRTPESDDELCECKSGETYGKCCKPFHSGERWPETPLQLMRSRYTAYAYRVPDWIIDTTHKTNSDWKSSRSKWFNELLGFCDGFNFNGLEIVDDKPGEEGEHYIEFVARMTAREKAPANAPKGVKQTLRRVKYQAGTDKVGADFRERSKFLKEDGKWLYQGGDVDYNPQATLIMEDGARLEPKPANPDTREEEGPDFVTPKAEHPANKKTTLRTYKAN